MGGYDAEDVVVDFFKSEFKGIEVRKATLDEDRGNTGIDTGKQIDAVLYWDHKPSLGLQITTAIDSKVRMKKMNELKNKPFIRLDEMNRGDTAIPKVLIFIEPRDVNSYLENKDWSAHSHLGNQILLGLENSLKFDRLQTKNQSEQKKIDEMLILLEEHKRKSLGKPQIH
jgi:hypothetical protein